jgi:chromosome segregation ATPase
MDEKLSKAKAQRGGLENLMAKLPFYKGYKEKELRRALDKQLRDTLAEQCQVQWKRIADLQRQLVDNGQLVYVDDLQTTETRLRRFMDRIRNASYGYSPVFDAVKVNEQTLEALYDFDASLVNQIAAIKAALDSLQEAIDANAGIPGVIREANAVVGAANDIFGSRENILKGTA